MQKPYHIGRLFAPACLVRGGTALFALGVTRPRFFKKRPICDLNGEGLSVSGSNRGLSGGDDAIHMNVPS